MKSEVIQMFAIPFGEIPPEMKAEIERRHQLSHMADENNRHEENRFLAELNAEQLKFLDQLIGSCMYNKKYGSYIRGRIDGVLLAAHSVCPCGKVHESAEEFVAHIALEEEQAAELTGEKLDHSELTDDQRQALLDEYGMEEVELPGDGVTDPPKLLRCKNCKAPSVTLEDRMLRAPGVEGCGTCQQQEKWG